MKNYSEIADIYAAAGVDPNRAMDILSGIPLSIHCWQGDDVAGFETADSNLSGGGIQVTGNYPGRARNIPELRQDIEYSFNLIPGKHRLNLHAIYGDFQGKKVDRNEIGPEHFQPWMEWSTQNGVPLDFNATCFSHPLAADGLTLSSKDRGIRNFWIEHVRAARRIAAELGKNQGNPSIHNLWIPDGFKDYPVDRAGYRRNLLEALDEIYSEELPEAHMKDALESKLFGIGSEAFVVGSHEFYMGYSLSRGKLLTLDTGHFHPTESVADKISAVLLFHRELLLHVSRPMHWDSDHVVLFNDDIRSLMEEIVRSGALDRIHIGLDFFDATINRIGAWTLGARNALKGLLFALLEPAEALQSREDSGDYFGRLALLENRLTLPFGAVWDEYCRRSNVPTDSELIAKVKSYEIDVLSRRGR